MDKMDARQTLLEIIRTGLRRETRRLDDTELVPLIEAAKMDLYSAGVSIVSERDALTRIAIKHFVIYRIEWDDKVEQAYQTTKNTMANMARYRGDNDAAAEPCPEQAAGNHPD